MLGLCQGLLLVAAPGLLIVVTPSWGAPALDVQASVAVEHGLRFPGACGIFPNQGWNPCPPHWQGDSYPPYQQGSTSVIFFFFKAHRLSCSVAWGGLPASGIELMSPALAGRFFTSEPPEKSPQCSFFR